MGYIIARIWHESGNAAAMEQEQKSETQTARKRDRDVTLVSEPKQAGSTPTEMTIAAVTEESKPSNAESAVIPMPDDATTEACPICLEDKLIEELTKPWGCHGFCHDCGSETFAKFRNCPICRKFKFNAASAPFVPARSRTR